jgi:tetratricopeptide (TPR) repeat protein
VESYYFPEEFKKDYKTAEFDYALLKLKEKVPAKEFLPLTIDHRKMEIGEETELHIWGYPKSIKEVKNLEVKKGLDGMVKSIYQYGFFRKYRFIKIRKEKVLIHQISTGEGQSGASIVCPDKQGRLVIVGVHKGGLYTVVEGEDIKANHGRLFTPEVIAALEKEASALGAEPFGVWQSDKQGKTASQYFQEGNALRRTGKHDEAIEAYRHCIALDPMHEPAHSNLGLALHKKGQLE